MNKFLSVLLAILGVSANAAVIQSEVSNGQANFEKLTEDEEVQLERILIKMYGNIPSAMQAKDDLYTQLNAVQKINKSIVIQGNLNCNDCHGNNPD